jgi:hypothetical protein
MKGPIPYASHGNPYAGVSDMLRTVPPFCHEQVIHDFTGGVGWLFRDEQGPIQPLQQSTGIPSEYDSAEPILIFSTHDNDVVILIQEFDPNL